MGVTVKQTPARDEAALTVPERAPHRIAVPLLSAPARVIVDEAGEVISPAPPLLCETIQAALPKGQFTTGTYNRKQHGRGR